MEQILGVGLPQDLVAGLTSRLPARIYSASSLAEARLLLRSLDFSSVILDLQMATLKYPQLCDLMGEAPLTTRFIALCNDPPEIDPVDLADVGIQSVMRSGADLLARKIA